MNENFANFLIEDFNSQDLHHQNVSPSLNKLLEHNEDDIAYESTSSGSNSNSDSNSDDSSSSSSAESESDNEILTPSEPVEFLFNEPNKSKDQQDFSNWATNASIHFQAEKSPLQYAPESLSDMELEFEEDEFEDVDPMN